MSNINFPKVVQDRGIDINGWHEGNALLTPVWYSLKEIKELGVENSVKRYFYNGTPLELPPCNRESKRGAGLKTLFEKYLLKKLTTIETILDIGCAQGQAGIWFSSAGKTYTGIEIALINVGFAIAMLPCLKHLGIDKLPRYFHMIAEDLKFPDKSFDIVFSNQVLDHTHDLNKALEEQFRVGKVVCGSCASERYEEGTEHMHWVTREKIEPYFSKYCSTYTIEIVGQDLIFWGEYK